MTPRPRPALLAGFLIGLTVAILPAPTRDRYREEFGTELAELGRWVQLAQAASLLLGSVALRQALTDRDIREPRGVSKDIRCRLRRHDYLLEQDDNPEMRGRAYLRCARCGAVKDPPKYGPMPPTALAAC